MIGLADLGLAPVTEEQSYEQDPHLDPDVEVDPYAPGPLQPGSIEAQAVWHTWRGQGVVIVNSPPGAGKSTLVARIIHRLAYETDLKIVVATPTVAAGVDLSRRLAQVTGPGYVMPSGSSFPKDLTAELNADALGLRGKAEWKRENPIVVRTVKSCQMSPPLCDILIIDEAYQVPFAEAAGASENADQVVMVGDPGQIGPTTTVDTSPWDRLTVAPHHRAPEGFATREDAVELRLPCTYRLGPVTTEAIAPLYDFPFYSARPQVSIGKRAEIETLTVKPSREVADPAAMKAIVKRVSKLVGSTLTSAQGEFEVGQEDVAVVAARNQQTSSLSALLRAKGLGNVTVGTADRLQGGQWAAVVSLDPFFGSPVGSSHSASLGRLCVMVSRHIAHLTWVTSSDWREVIEATHMDEDDAAAHVAVREAMAADSVA